jgi:hypothetical protein
MGRPTVKGCLTAVSSAPRPGDGKVAGAEPANRPYDGAKDSIMSSLKIPALPDIDYAQAIRDARWEHLKSLVSQDAVWDAFKAHLNLISNSRSNPLAKTFTELCELPPEDVYELQGIVQGMRIREKVALADAVLELMGTAWLSVAQDMENRPF